MVSSPRDSEFPADLSPLAWVQEELRRSLESVHKTLRRLVRDGGDNRLSAFGGDAQPSVPLQQAAATPSLRKKCSDWPNAPATRRVESPRW